MDVKSLCRSEIMSGGQQEHKMRSLNSTCDNEYQSIKGSEGYLRWDFMAFSLFDFTEVDRVRVLEGKEQYQPAQKAANSGQQNFCKLGL
jgi:hypothetical protein